MLLCYYFSIALLLEYIRFKIFVPQVIAVGSKEWKHTDLESETVNIYLLPLR